MTGVILIMIRAAGHYRALNRAMTHGHLITLIDATQGRPVCSQGGLCVARGFLSLKPGPFLGRPCRTMLRLMVVSATTDSDTGTHRPLKHSGGKGLELCMRTGSLTHPIAMFSNGWPRLKPRVIAVL